MVNIKYITIVFLSKYVKVRHYNTVENPEGLNGAKHFILKRKEDIRMNETQVLGDILGPRHGWNSCIDLELVNQGRKQYIDIQSLQHKETKIGA